MKAGEFVQKLREIAPRESELRALGITDISDFLNSYTAKRKGSITLLGSQKFDEILNLLADYDLKTIALGPITFFENYVEFDDFYAIGEMFPDYLALDKVTGEIVVFDHAQKYSIVYYCSENGTRFLDAMIECIVFLKGGLLDDEIYKNNALAKKEAFRIAKLAGNGKRYYPFYFSFLGCD
jgi:hypothetical protein